MKRQEGCKERKKVACYDRANITRFRVTLAQNISTFACLFPMSVAQEITTRQNIMATLKNSVWSAMDYKPPRGGCNHKASLISGTCPCLRFMLHPVKVNITLANLISCCITDCIQAATSFDCDGCGHHASFHSLENTAENAILEKWSEQEAIESQSTVGASKKRRRIAAKATESIEVLELEDETSVTSDVSSSRRRAAKQPQKVTT